MGGLIGVNDGWMGEGGRKEGRKDGDGDEDEDVGWGDRSV